MAGKKKDRFVELEIESIAFKGKAVGKKDGFVYFVNGAAPGDKVIARVLKKKKAYAEAQAVEILEYSKDRVEAPCIHFAECGGCSWQHLSYEKQLFWKEAHVREAFERLAKIDAGEYFPIIPSPQSFNYRNKMEFSFGASRWMSEEEIISGEEIDNKHFALGLHKPGRFDKVLDIKECLIHPDSGNEILNLIRKKAKELGASPYNARTHEGFLRNLVLRYSRANDEIMCILITQSPDNDEARNFLRWYETEFQGLIKKDMEIIHALNDGPAQVARGAERIICGKGYITEKIMGIDFRISPFSFFQVNPFQLDQFIGRVIDSAKLSGGETVWDLYCGAGSITLPSAKSCNEIIGVEIEEGAVADARENAERNGIDNARFIAQGLHTKDAQSLINSFPTPDVIFIDPPRAGLHKNLIPKILESGATRIVYVSCNPATQARDCEALSEKYTVKSLTPVDMFPQTYHIEAIAVLELR